MNDTCQILLVEDNSDDVYLFMRAAGFSCPNMEIIVAGDPIDARKRLEHISSVDHPPSLIVSDLKMPRVNGIEFITWLRSQPHLETLPVILLSSSAETRDVQEAYAAGANLYMVKPTSLSEYTTLLRQIGNYCAERTSPVDERFLVPRPQERV